MKRTGKILLLLCFLFLEGVTSAQITVPNVTACPNQVMTLTATWNNVANITYTLFSPPVLTPGVPVGPTFTLVNASQVPTTLNYTLMGTGNGNLGVVTSTCYFSFAVIPPGAMSITNTVNYCYGDNASLICPSGGTLYSVTSNGCFNSTSSSNVITFPLNVPNCTGQYTVSSLIAGCTTTGVTSINVAPNNQISVNTASNICQGGSALLTATLNTGADYQWFDNTNTPIGANTNPMPLTGLTINQSGVYTVTANIVFAGGALKCPRTATTQVTVVQTSPVLATASPSNIICQGTNLNLSGSTGVPASGWTWNGPASFYSTLQAPVISLASPLNSGNYTVTALFIGSFTTCQTSAIVNVSVIPVYQPVITMPNSVCQNAQVTMSATTSGGAPTYDWIGPCFGPGTTGQVQSITSAQPNCSGTYYVSAKFSYFGTQCISTSSAVLSVVPVSTITVIPPGQVCTPTNANLQANAYGANLFTWVGPNGYSTPGANVIVYYPTPAASGIYTVTAYFGGGNITCKNTNTAQLVVNPVLNFTLVPRLQMCYGEAVNIVGPAGATSYTWTSSTGYKSNTKDVSFTAIQPKNAGTYTLNVSLGPCITSGETTIDVVSPIFFTLVPSSKTICRGDTIVLEGGVTSGSENYAYTWNPAVYLDSPNGPKKVVAPLGTVLYNLIVFDIACPNYTIAHSFSITVNQPPNPDIQLNPATGCAPFKMFLNSKTRGSAAITTYDFGGILQVQGDSIPYTLNEPGTYIMNIYTKGKNGCGGSYTYPYPIVVNANPGTDFIIEPELPTTVDEITFKPSSSYSPIEGYRWLFAGAIDPHDTSAIKVKAPGTDTTSQKEPVRLYSNPGKYPVLLITTTDSQCIDTLVKYIKVIDDLRIYIPNAFTPNDDGINDVFAVKGQGMKTDNYSLQIVDRWGDVVFSSKDINEAWDGRYNGVVVRDGVYNYYLKVVGQNGEGRKEISGYVTVIK
ncbi:MAG: gliding motility-associated C-terminal domain-containing protein [bacterium]|nr:gliding motility-associated C-terminal domain-containing protein [bacterium]